MFSIIKIIQNKDYLVSLLIDSLFSFSSTTSIKGISFASSLLVNNGSLTGGDSSFIRWLTSCLFCRLLSQRLFLILSNCSPCPWSNTPCITWCKSSATVRRESMNPVASMLEGCVTTVLDKSTQISPPWVVSMTGWRREEQEENISSSLLLTESVCVQWGGREREGRMISKLPPSSPCTAQWQLVLLGNCEG